MTRSRAVLAFITLALVFAAAAMSGGVSYAEPIEPPTADEVDRLRVLAESRYEEGSFAQARDAYERLMLAELDDVESRFVAYRAADSAWRAFAATRSRDTSDLDAARLKLREIADAVENPEDRDEIWAFVQESLGDSYIATRYRDMNATRNHYSAALDWWAGSSDVETARRRYLDIVFRMAEPWGSQWLDLKVLENARTIARSDADRARAHYYLATGLQNQTWHPRNVERIVNEFAAAVSFGKASPFYDDALYHSAHWLRNNGRVVFTPDGSWHTEPDYKSALEQFRTLVAEFDKSESRYYDDAKRAIDSIVGPVVGVSVSNTFLPDSLISFQTNWRNVDEVDFTLHAVDLGRDIKMEGRRGPHQWMTGIDLSGKTPVRSWSIETDDGGDHVPGGRRIDLDEPLAPGAYVLTASSEGRTARDLVLVTDLAIVVKSWRDRVLAFTCDAITGKPVAATDLRLLDFRYRDERWIGDEVAGVTGADGTCTLAVDRRQQSGVSEHGLLVAAKVGDRQAFAVIHKGWIPNPDRSWRVYATSDRPVYRPEDTVKWKITSRVREPGGWATPAGAALTYTIKGPRGDVESGDLTLNEFGSAWGEIALSPSMALGEYTIALQLGGKHVASPTIFRLEEYKLPEFEVTVNVPTDDEGRRQTYRLGDTVEVDVDAAYYFGGPVAGAEVEIVVHRDYYWATYQPPRRYGWLYEDPNAWRYRGYGSTVVKQETIHTDELGRARVRFDTEAGGSQDYEYRIEARVRDASRREVSGQGTVRVTRQRYYAHLNAEHKLHHPDELASVDVRTLDANGEGTAESGRVTISRLTWREIWIDPIGTRVSGPALEDARRRHGIFPPPGPHRWRMHSSGYEAEVIATLDVQTDDEGVGTIEFTPDETGYYAVRWVDRDERPAVLGETHVWVCGPDTKHVGYHTGGVELIVDSDTAKLGKPLPVMITTRARDRWVLLTVEGHDLHHREVVHVTGTAKFIELPIDDRHVPNVTLSVTMIDQGTMHADAEAIVVPPDDHFLDVAITADREAYEPGETGTFTVTALDANGDPVRAELTLAVIDDAVRAIQGDLAGDPRKHFYHDKQPHSIATANGFIRGTYVRLVELDDGQRVDERVAALYDEDESGATAFDSFAAMNSPAGPLGGMGGGSLDAGREMARGGRARGRAPARRALASTATPAPMQSPMMPQADAAMAKNESGAKPGLDGSAIEVRSDFRSTVLWRPDVITDADGRAVVEATFSDAVTRWTATARATTEHTDVGIDETSTRTRKPLIARLQAPRFLVVGDVATFSGLFDNNTDEPLEIDTQLSVEGLRVDGVVGDLPDALVVPAGGQVRVDWRVTALEAGAAEAELLARGGLYSDGMTKTYPVVEHGIEKFLAQSVKLAPDTGSMTLSVELPSARREGSTDLVVQVAPSLAVTMLDALPYLVDYPYGCTEQTMSRFLPAVVTAKTLGDVGLSVDDALGRVFGGIERAHVDRTHPDGAERRENLRKLQEIANQGLARLADFQQGDGGWGWWKTSSSDRFMTAYVVWGLALAAEADIDVAPDMLDGGIRYLGNEIVEAEQRPNLRAWMLHALTAACAVRDAELPQSGRVALDELWKARRDVSAYGRALLALSAHRLGEAAKTEVLARNLVDGAHVDRPDASIITGASGRGNAMTTAHWGETAGWWRWFDGGIETTSFALMALTAIDPDHELVEPAMTWLVRNRRGAQWSNTRDTAMAVLALNDYLRGSGELAGDVTYEVRVNDNAVDRIEIAAADVLAAPARIDVDAALLHDGANEVEIVRVDGDAPLYVSTEATFFSLEEPITPAGNEIFVRRDYYRLAPRETLLKGIVYDRMPLADGGYIDSGDRVEVVLTMEAKNDYEYLVFEDLKPAGFEAVDLLSGSGVRVRQLRTDAIQAKLADAPAVPEDRTREPGVRHRKDYTGASHGTHRELRDRKVAIFIDRLEQGYWELRYDLRAEVPGHFHALPVVGYAMYVPEIRCNGAEVRIDVTDE